MIYGIFLTIAGVLGTLISFIISIEKNHILSDPNYVPSCSINPIISCGNVMETAQASAFGFPNSWMGIAGFAMVLVVGIGILAGATYKKWFLLLFNLGTFLAVIFVHWLFVQSVYVIGALCPWCIGIWVITIATFWYTTLRNLKNYVVEPRGIKNKGVIWLYEYKNLILLVWYLIIFIAIVHHFWYFFKTLL